MPPIPLDRFDQVDSTSRVARAWAAGRPISPPRAFISAEQTGGVGRMGRAWHSPRGGLWCTVCWPMPEASLREAAVGLGLRVGLACAEAIEVVAAGAPRAAIKWPNDVFLNSKKVSGALVESIAAPRGAWILAGVGVNANFGVDALPPELRATATTLRDATGRDVDLDALLRALLDRLSLAIPLPGLPPQTLAAIRVRLHGVGAPLRVRRADGSATAGTLRGIDDHGRALLETDAGVVAVASGELEDQDPAQVSGPGAR